jgi:hypothetical protein
VTGFFEPVSAAPAHSRDQRGRSFRRRHSGRAETWRINAACWTDPARCFLTPTVSNSLGLRSF